MKSRGITILLYLIVLATVVVGGYYLVERLIPTPKIGIIELQVSLSSFSAERLSQEIDYAINTPNIKGVVLVVDSPGGSASAGYDVYYQVRRLRDAKPVIASIDSLAASGAYHVSVAANEIYAKPASAVGNVGVIFRQPSPETLSEISVTSGPFKNTGFNSSSNFQKLELLAADMRDTIAAERSQAPNPLKLSPDELATGELWLGLEAKAYGLIDELGSRLDAIDAAAQLAGVKNYSVIDVREEYLASLQEEERQSVLQQYVEAEARFNVDMTGQDVSWPIYYEVYVPLE